MVEEIVKLLIDKNITIGSAESLTGGLFASTISNVPGVSKVYKGSIISYSTLIKENVLKISHELVSKVGVVSYEVAYEMANKVKDILDVDLALSFTGNAGPDAMEGKPVGLVYIGIAYENKVEVKELHLSGSRQEIRQKCVEEAFKLIKEKLI
jgi:nicotinamide-nucleotide amidase